MCWLICKYEYTKLHKCGFRGGTGGPDPPGKSQVIWVSIGNKLLDPPPPPGTLRNDRFLWNWPFDICKISWGLKKKKNVVRAFLSDWPGPPPPPPPDENSWIRAFCIYKYHIGTRNTIILHPSITYVKISCSCLPDPWDEKKITLFVQGWGRKSVPGDA